MQKEELAKWMKSKGIDEQLRVWVQNDIVGHADYTILEDLVSTGEANITLTLNAYGNLTIAKTEPLKETLTYTSVTVTEPKYVPMADMSGLPDPTKSKPRARKVPK